MLIAAWTNTDRVRDSSVRVDLKKGGRQTVAPTKEKCEGSRPNRNACLKKIARHALWCVELVNVERGVALRLWLILNPAVNFGFLLISRYGQTPERMLIDQPPIQSLSTHSFIHSFNFESKQQQGRIFRAGWWRQ
jgi:hypothetical protein